MDLENSFTVDVGVDRAWDVLTDIPAIAPCLPGAQLQEVEGDDYKGIVKVKVGPIVAQYKGTATIQAADPSQHRIELLAEGRETRGQGNAKALITATMTERDGRTDVVVQTQLTVTGKVAQFGRGVMADVSGKLMDQFSSNLVEQVLSEPSEPVETPEAAPVSSNGNDGGSGDAPATESGPRKFEPGAEPEPIDLLGTAGVPAAQRIVPAVLGALLAMLVIRWLVRRRRG